MALGLRWTIAAAILCGSPAVAAAQAESSVRGFRVGLTLPVSQLGATMRKSVDNTAPNTLVPEPRRGRVFQDEVSGDGLSYGVGLVGGYRFPLSGGSWFLDAEVAGEWHGGATEAQFAGVGVSAERKQLGESWPDDWSFAKEMSYGAGVRLGGSPAGLVAGDVAFYLLADVRFAEVQFTNNYDGCFSAAPCTPAEFASGSEDIDMDFTVWRAGIGMEKWLGQRFALRAEAGYSMYATEEWVTPFSDVGVTVDSRMDASAPGLSLGLVRRF